MSRVDKPFFSPSEQDEFTKPNRIIKRTIEVVNEQTDKRERKPLLNYFTDRLNTLGKQENIWFACACITVKHNDGMTWSAETVKNLFKEKYPSFEGWWLANEIKPDSMPKIADYIGRRRFLKMAVDNKLTTSFITLRPWMSPLIFGSVIVLTALGKILSELLSKKLAANGSSFLKYLWDPTVVGIALAIAVLGIITQAIITHYTTMNSSKSITNFLDNLGLKQTTRDYTIFIDDIAKNLPKIHLPRVVIIDNYENLDFTTKVVIQRYFEKYAENASGSEFWIIFDGDDGERFSNLVLLNRHTFGYYRTDTLQQLPLDQQERTELAAKVEKPERANYSTVKAICHITREEYGVSKLDFFHDYRSLQPYNPNRYGSLEFLYLIALTAIPCNISMNYRFWVDKFSRKEGLESELFAEFLRGTKSRKDEFRACLLEIHKHFSSFIIEEGSGELTKLLVMPELTELFIERYNELQLPNPGLGHLFWSVFWYNKRQNAPIEALYIRKITHHLLNSDTSFLDNEELYIKCLRQLFDAHIYAIDGCLKTCLFANIKELVNSAFFILENKALKANKSHFNRLLSRCWGAYSVLGDEEIYSKILQIESLLTTEFVQTKSEEDVLETLFFESTTLTPIQRNLFQKNFFNFTRGRKDLVESATDYSKTRSILLALTVSPFFDSVLKQTILYRAGIESDKQSTELIKKAYQRILSHDEDYIPLSDVITMSLCLWAQALRLDTATIRKRLRSIGKLISEENIQLEKFVDFQNLVKQARDIIFLANILEYEAIGNHENSRGRDFLMNGLVRELCAVALSSVSTAYSSLPENVSRYTEAEVYKYIDEIFELSTKLTGIEMPSFNIKDGLPTKLITRINKLMRISEIIWASFKLEHLCSFMKIRRFFFNSVCMKLEPEEYESNKSFLDGLSREIGLTSFIGLLTNITISNRLRSAEDFAYHYFCQAASIAVQEQFGVRLRNEMSIAVVRMNHTSNKNLSKYVKYLLESPSGNENYLKLFLQSQPEDFVFDIVVCCNNAAGRCKDKEVVTGIKEAIIEFQKNIKNEVIKDQISALMDVDILKENLHKKQIIDVDQILEQWKHRRKSQIYPLVLEKLIENNYKSNRLLRESLYVLDKDFSEDDLSSYIYLSMVLTDYLLKENMTSEIQVPMQYLKKSIETWKSHLTAIENLFAYRLLFRIDVQNRRNYEREIEKWEEIELNRQHLNQFPELIKKGRFFLVFRDYFNSMKFWGLRTDLKPNELLLRFNLEDKLKIVYVANWKSANQSVPEPLITDGEEILISSEFLTLGTFLFEPPFIDNLSLDQERRDIDEKAKEAIPQLIETIFRLPELPAVIKELLRSYHERLFQYTLPT